MTGPSDRRGFLRGLATLPLIGGGVTLIGNPTRAAEPVTQDLLQNYNAWLCMERQHLLYEMHPDKPADYFNPNTAGGMYFWRAIANGQPTPSTRAAVVLSAVGCDWKRSISHR